MMFSKFSKNRKTAYELMDNTEAFVYIRDKKYAITGMRYEKGKLVGFQMNEKEVLEVK